MFKKKEENLQHLSILNKISHKPLIIESVFPFLDNRPSILPYLLDKDIYLKKKLNEFYSNLFSKINLHIYKYITYNLLFKTEISFIFKGKKEDYNEDTEDFLEDLSILFKYNDKNNIEIKDEFNFNYPLNDLIIMLEASFKNKKIPDNINVKKSLLNNYIPKDEAMLNFIKDYNSQNKILYIPYPKNNNYSLLIDKMIEYLNNKKDINEIKAIVFDDSFTIENLENFVEKGEKIKEYNFPSLEFIYTKVFINDLRTIKLKYKLNKLFSEESLMDLTIINYKDFKNIKYSNEKEKQILKKKLDKENEILYLDLQGYSPFQQKFYFFCVNYLKNNDNDYIKIILIDNLGIIDDDINFQKNNQIINFSNIKNIYYENYQKESKGNKVKEFINLYFDKNNLNYLIEGFNQEGDLNYINLSDQINLDIIKKTKNEPYLYKIDLHYKNITMTYNEELKKLSLRKNNLKGNFDKYYKINEIKYEELVQNFINDLAKFCVQLFINNKVKFIIEDGLTTPSKIKEKIFIEKIKKNTKILTSSLIFNLSEHLNFCKYYPYEESIKELIYNTDYFSDKKFLFVATIDSLFNSNKYTCMCIYFDNKNNEGFYLAHAYDKADEFNYRKLIIKREYNPIIEIEKKFVLQFNEYNYSILIKKYGYNFFEAVKNYEPHILDPY